MMRKSLQLQSKANLLRNYPPVARFYLLKREERATLGAVACLLE